MTLPIKTTSPDIVAAIDRNTSVLTRIAVALEGGGEADIPDELGAQVDRAAADLEAGTASLRGAVDSNS